MKDEEVIKLHPKGENGGMIPLKAMKALKPGMTLQLLPAEYWSKIEIPTDRISVTSEGEKLNYSVVIKGKDCVVNNLRCNTLTILEDILILDSSLDSLNIGNWEYDSKIKLKAYIYNTAFNHFITLGGANNLYSVEMKNCLVKSGLAIYSNTKMAVEESVLLSEGYVFTFNELWNAKKGRLLLKNNLLFGKSGYAMMEDTPYEKKRGMRVTELKNMKEVWSTNLSGDHVCEAPKFQTEYKLFLAEDSPGKGRGLVPEEHPLFEILKQKKENIEDKLEEKKKRREEIRKKWMEAKERIRKEIEERKKRSEEENPPPPEPPEDEDNDAGDDGEIGGIPTPPE